MGTKPWLSKRWLSKRWLSKRWLSKRWLLKHWLSKRWLTKHWLSTSIKNIDYQNVKKQNSMIQNVDCYKPSNITKRWRYRILTAKKCQDYKTMNTTKVNSYKMLLYVGQGYGKTISGPSAVARMC